MTRPLRIEYENAFYHIITRGNEQKDIFKEDADKDKFLTYFEILYRRYEIKIYAYVLMNNHYHLLMKTPQGNLSKVMHDLNTRYAAYFNKRYQRIGHLFHGRYRGILLEGETYLLTLSRYIHLNPVKGKLVNAPEAYPYSSAVYYVTNKMGPEWFDCALILSHFSQNAAEAKERYLRFLYDGIKDKSDPFKDLHAQIILGRQDFIEKTLKKISENKTVTSEFSESKQLNHKKELKDIEDKVYKYFNIKKENIQGCYNRSKEKKIFIYLAREHTNISLEVLVRYLGDAITGSAISKIVSRVKAALNRDKQLKQDITRLESLLNL